VGPNGGVKLIIIERGKRGKDSPEGEKKVGDVVPTLNPQGFLKGQMK